jgi:hypothetical protein
MRKCMILFQSQERYGGNYCALEISGFYWLSVSDALISRLTYKLLLHGPRGFASAIDAANNTTTVVQQQD